MATLKALWTEIVHTNVAWYDEYVAHLELELHNLGGPEKRAITRAKSEGRTRLVGYSETKLPTNYTQLFHMAGVFRGYRNMAKRITELDGKLIFLSVFPRGCNEGLDNALHYHQDAADVELEPEPEHDDDNPTVA